MIVTFKILLFLFCCSLRNIYDNGRFLILEYKTRENNFFPLNVHNLSTIYVWLWFGSDANYINPNFF